MSCLFVIEDAEDLVEGIFLFRAGSGGLGRGGGAFFGRVGSFEEGFAFDAVVLDDACEPCARPLPVRERLERAFYLELDRKGIVMKIADGERSILNS